jgi:hypothetical protein
MKYTTSVCHTCPTCPDSSMGSTSDLGIPCTRKAGQSLRGWPSVDVKSGLKPSLSNLVFTGTHCSIQQQQQQQVEFDSNMFKHADNTRCKLEANVVNWFVTNAMKHIQIET